ncbi:MAG: hypothetical protein KC996_10045 [Phycisphaerales bacterium]|nr:hypothetical protein [Phycisphaerales bacterium]
MTLILVFGVLLAIFGVWGVVKAVRGRPVSDHPHCRSCRFDLHGLELTRDSKCPECGHITPPDTRYVLSGLRKRRPVLLLVSLLMLLIGLSGVAWPKLSTIPAIKNIDWYASSPEWMLLWLESTGNMKALQELHDRLIPGEVSDEGLQTLVERAFKHQADTRTPWDQRWGDVLCYAFFSEKMKDQDAIRYMEKAVVFEFDVHAEIGLEDTQLGYWVRESNAERGMSSTDFRFEWNRRTGNTGFGDELDSPYQLAIVVNTPKIIGNDTRINGGWMLSNSYDPDRGGWWIPYKRRSSASGSSLWIDPAKTGDAFEIQLDYAYTVYKGPKEVLHREFSPRVKIRRVADPVYAAVLTDPAVLTPLAEGLTISSMQIPTELEIASEHENIRSGSQSVLEIESRLGSDHQLLGDLWLRSGGEEILFKPIAIELKAAVHYGIQPPSDFNTDQSWLDYFSEHQEFFDRVIAEEQLDVVYRPDPSRAAMDPRIRSVVASPILFRDVPIDLLVPQPVAYSRGIPRWAMVRKNTPEVGVSYTLEEYEAMRRPGGVAGELLVEE